MVQIAQLWHQCECHQCHLQPDSTLDRVLLFTPSTTRWVISVNATSDIYSQTLLLVGVLLFTPSTTRWVISVNATSAIYSQTLLWIGFYYSPLLPLGEYSSQCECHQCHQCHLQPDSALDRVLLFTLSTTRWVISANATIAIYSQLVGRPRTQIYIWFVLDPDPSKHMGMTGSGSASPQHTLFF